MSWRVVWSQWYSSSSGVILIGFQQICSHSWKILPQGTGFFRLFSNLWPNSDFYWLSLVVYLFFVLIGIFSKFPKKKLNFQGNFSELLLKKSPEPCVHGYAHFFSIYEDLATRSPHNNIEDSKYANMHFEYCSNICP